MKPVVALTLPELTSLLLQAKEHCDERAYVLFLLGALHGLRISELVNLRRQDFSEASGEMKSQNVALLDRDDGTGSAQRVGSDVAARQWEGAGRH